MGMTDPSRRAVLRQAMGMAMAAPAATVGAAAPKPAAPPDLGASVSIIDPTMPAATIQARVDAIFRRQESAHFTDERHALLFLPGRYAADVSIGFFTQIAGLGLMPGDVTIDGHVHVEADWAKGMALDNFWRGAENLTVRPPDGADRWAVSQASPYRRIHLHGDLALDDGGWSSGGFMADCRIEGTVRSGTQQQWFTRSSALGGWRGSNWNMMFMGVDGAPPTTFPEPPITTLASVPVIREKPFLHVDPAGVWGVFVPAPQRDARGPSWATGVPAGLTIALSRFLVARPDTPVERINAALADGAHLLLTPGVYRLTAPISVRRPGSVVLGLGLATLVAGGGRPALTVADVPGVTVAGLLVDAGPVLSPLLIEVGPPGSARDHAANPTLLADLYVRIGGAAPGRAGTALAINSRNVLCDNLWLWRADHGDRAGGRVHVGWDENPAERGLVVVGPDVTAYGLFVEHFRRHQVEWHGERGRTFFYQSELPYDPPSQAAYRNGNRRGWASYRVGDSVKVHRGAGFGIYANFTADPSIVVDSAVRAPDSPGIRFEDVTTISLGGGMGTIAHLVNDTGAAATKGAVRQTLVRVGAAVDASS